MIHPLTQHYSALRRLPGVVAVDTALQGQNECIDIRTEDATEAHFLDTAISDTIKGRDVRFSHAGPEIAPAPRDFYPADEILLDYGRMIKGLPGVTHLGTMTIKCGEWLPAQEKAIEVVAETASEAKLLDELLEDDIAGTSVLVRSEKEKFDQYGRKKAFSLN